MFKYFQNHPYATGIGIVVGIISIILAFVFWLFPITPKNTKENNPPIAVFDLAEKISSEKTSLDQQERLNEYLEQKVYGSGFVLDVAQEKETPFSQSYLVVDIAKSLEKNEYGGYINPIVKCKYSEDWRKTLKSLSFSDEIKFTGTITDEGNYRNSIFVGPYRPELILSNCAVVN